MLAMEMDTKPKCPCCKGQELHVERAADGNPERERDAECTTCAGTGRSWHHARLNSCAGFRSLQRRVR